jgi:diguanylate cyclase (GGDEF)-like protein
VRSYLLACVGVALLLLAAAEAVLAGHSLDKARADVRHRAAFEAALATQAVQTSIHQAQTQLAGVASTLPLDALLATPDKCTLTFTGVGVFPSGHIDIVLPDGRVACSSVVSHGAPPGASQQGAPWLAAAASGPAVSGLFRDGLTGSRSIAITAPLTGGPSASSSATGVIAVVLPVAPLAGELAERYGGPGHFEFAVAEPDGTVLSTSAGGSTGASTDGSTTGSTDGSTDGSTAAMPVTGENTGWIEASKPLHDLGWQLVAGQQASAALAPTRSLLLSETVLAGLALLVVLGLLALVNRRIATPLRRFAASVTRLGHEVRPQPVTPSGPAELRQVADRFNAMLAARMSFEDKMAHDALHDPLTGLANQVLLLDRLATACDLAAGANVQVALVAVGIDRFDLINTSLGYRAGDDALIALATRIEGSLRPRQTLARLGGGAFAVLLPDGADRDAALAEAAMLARVIARPLEAAGTTLTLTASIGVAIAESSWSADDVFRNATTAMHSAKEHGGARCELFQPSLRVRANTRLRLENDLSQALRRGQLYVEYQPVIDLPSRRISGAEALVRWRHPVRGVVPPATFIPIAEQTALIEEIGRFVLDEACAQACAWQRLGYRMRVAVNVSGRQLLGGGFAEQVAEVLHSYALPAEQLCLELTESILMEDLLRTSTALHALKGLGVRLSVDDFGTGYSSLSYLQRFPVDELKIDRTFVAGLGEADDRNLVAAVIGIAHALGLRVVAEGVENDKQLSQLIMLGCRSAQGYLLGRPQNPCDLTARLDRQPLDLDALSTLG